MKPHVIFFHQNYPAQFGPISQFLVEEHGARVSFFSEYVTKPVHPGIQQYTYKRDTWGQASLESNFFFSRYFDQECRSMYGVLKAYEAARIESPDVFVGHVGFGNLMLLHVAYPEVPSVGFFEIFYDPFDPATYSRPDFPVPRENILRMPLRNATQMLELEYCTRGYSPTPYQKSTFPKAYQHKLETLFDGIDTALYRPGEVTSESLLERTWPADAKIVTYVARGLESIRGFDVFMKIADKICRLRPDVHFVVAGKKKTHYGSEAMHLKGKTFYDYVIDKGNYDLSRFTFLDWIPEPALVDLYRLSDCHVYWTMPFTLSWSFFQALSTGAMVVASNSPPVRDVLVHGENGLLVEPDDEDGFVESILSVLDNPKQYQPHREAARTAIVENYSLDVCLPRLVDFYLNAGKDNAREAVSANRPV